jgi:hypothetical protein
MSETPEGTGRVQVTEERKQVTIINAKRQKTHNSPKNSTKKSQKHTTPTGKQKSTKQISKRGKRAKK